VDELTLLQAIRLKGRVRPADLAATLAEDETAVQAAVDDLAAAGLTVEGKSIRLSPDGRTKLTTLLAAERHDVDSAAVARLYDEFRSINGEFKLLVSQWQLKEGEPNDHTDGEYDAAILERLEGIHQAVRPVLAAAAAQLPRLDAYSTKLSAALEKVRAGETTWFTRPIVDSYHTVWFELHEELIGAAGLTRDDEAKAGHAE
jgi:hypothetical protein